MAGGRVHYRAGGEAALHGAVGEQLDASRAVLGASDAGACAAGDPRRFGGRLERPPGRRRGALPPDDAREILSAAAHQGQGAHAAHARQGKSRRHG